MLDPDGQIHRGEVTQSAESIDQLFGQWRSEYGDVQIDVCLETSRGALINVLLEQPGICIYPVIKSLPCGMKSQARIIAALGDDRQRFASADELAAATGIAPLTIQSGKSRYVGARWACSKFLRQTFHEFAGVTITRSRWAKAYYDQQLASGKSSRTAKRALAYKWIRIIFRCWQSRTPYNEAHYISRLIATNSPLAQKFPPIVTKLQPA
jgi:hypothetical protein